MPAHQPTGPTPNQVASTAKKMMNRPIPAKNGADGIQRNCGEKARHLSAFPDVHGISQYAFVSAARLESVGTDAA